VNWQALYTAGAVALEAGDYTRAEQFFRGIVEQDDRAHQAWNALSVVAVRQGLPDVAAERARQAVALDRRNPIYLNNLAVAYGELRRFEEAETTFRRALKLKPVYAEGMFNLGKVLHKRGKLGESLRTYERAYVIDPEFPGLRVSLAQMYRQHGQLDKAMVVVRQAPGPMNELLAILSAECLAELEGPESALAWIRKTTAEHADWSRMRAAMGDLLLSLGEWREGWKEYLLRPMPLTVGLPRTLSLPLRLDGKRVLLRSEQGLGDVLFFLRFGPGLRERGARIALICWPKLVPLLESSRALDEVIDSRSSVDESCFDLMVWLGDLPVVLDSNAPAGPIPLHCESATLERIARRLADLGPAPYLALTWRAGTDVVRQREFGNARAVLSKELPLIQLGQAVRNWPGTLVAFQREPYPGEIEAVSNAAAKDIHDLSALNDDLRHMLAALSLIDEYVTVSNTNVHLLAGLGKSARVLVPYPPHWLWMQGGANSPWFPGSPVYRQPRSRDWSAPFSTLRADLEARWSMSSTARK
jgi:Tfp pilus assembly protein PilF